MFQLTLSLVDVLIDTISILISQMFSCTVLGYIWTDFNPAYIVFETIVSSHFLLTLSLSFTSFSHLSCTLPVYFLSFSSFSPLLLSISHIPYLFLLSIFCDVIGLKLYFLLNGGVGVGWGWCKVIIRYER